MCDDFGDEYDCGLQIMLYELASVVNNTWTNEHGVSYVSHNALKNLIIKWQNKHDEEIENV